MNIHTCLETIKNIQRNILNFIENEDNTEESFRNLTNQFDDQNIHDNEHLLNLIFHLLASICDNHYRERDFFSKIERVIQYFKEDIPKYFTNSEIFNIFKKNKRILLFLIEEKMLIVDYYFVKSIFADKYYEMNYPKYFAPEIKAFINESRKRPNKKSNYISIDELQEELPDNFYEKK